MAGKGAIAGWVGRGPRRSGVLVAAVGLLLGCAMGLGVGYKIEQSRTRSDVKRLTAKLANNRSAATRGKHVAVKGSALLNERNGKVTKIDSNTITVQTKRGKSFAIHTTSATGYEQAVAGKRTDITVGHRVVLTTSDSEALVLGSNSVLGLPVTKVGSNSITIAKSNGRGTTTLPLGKVKAIDTTRTARSSDIKNGSAVLAGGRMNKGTFDATEVILLPSASGFVN